MNGWNSTYETDSSLTDPIEVFLINGTVLFFTEDFQEILEQEKEKLDWVIYVRVDWLNPDLFQKYIAITISAVHSFL